MINYLEMLLEDRENRGMISSKEGALKESIDMYYTKDEMYEMNEEYFISWAQKGFFKDSGKKLEKLTKNPTKKYLVDVLYEFLDNKEVFNKAFDAMETVVKEALFSIAWNVETNIETLYKNYNVKIKNTDGFGRMLNRKFRFFKTYDAFRGIQQGPLFVDPLIVGALRKVMQFDEERRAPIHEESGTKYVENCEKEILGNIEIIMEMKHSGKIRLGSNGGILKSVYKNIEKELTLEEFYNNTKIDAAHTIKKNLITEIFSNLQLDKIEEKDSAEETLKEIVTEILKGRAFLEEEYFGIRNRMSFVKIFLTHFEVSGFNGYGENIYDYLNGIKYLLLYLSDKKWVKIEEFYTLLLLYDTKPFTYYENEAGAMLRKNLPYNYRSKSNMNEEIEKYIFMPFIRGTAAFFATLGVVEIGYNDISVEEASFKNSVYKGIDSIRVTELGKYLLGINREYICEAEESNLEIELSDKETVFSVKGSDRKKERIIERISENIGECRYKVNFKSIFAGCTTEEEVTNKIERFKKIAGELPLNWEKMFDKVISGFNSIEKIENTVVLKLKEDKELINAIIQDTRIKKHILKAEKYHIIVDAERVQYIRQILKEYGYF